MLIINYALHATGFSTFEAAKTIAEALQSYDEDGWTYTVISPPEGKGFYFVGIYDEDGIFVARYSV